MIIVFGSWTIVSPGNVKLIVRLGTISRELNSGLNFKIPLIENAINFDIRTKKDNFDASAASKDLQNVSANIAVNYNLDPKSVSKMYQNVGEDYVERVLAPAVHESIKASTAKYTADELITKRAEVKDTMKNILAERMASY